MHTEIARPQDNYYIPHPIDCITLAQTHDTISTIIVFLTAKNKLCDLLHRIYTYYNKNCAPIAHPISRAALLLISSNRRQQSTIYTYSSVGMQLRNSKSQEEK